MNRTAGRQQIVAALESLSLFAAVLSGTPSSFGGKTPVAVVSSTSMLGGLVTRGVIQIVNAWTVSIYVQRPAQTEEATEDALDTLTLSTILALLQAGDFAPQQSDASAGGSPNRIIDGFVYRVERIPVTLASNAEE